MSCKKDDQDSVCGSYGRTSRSESRKPGNWRWLITTQSRRLSGASLIHKHHRLMTALEWREEREEWWRRSRAPGVWFYSIHALIDFKWDRWRFTFQETRREKCRRKVPKLTHCGPFVMEFYPFNKIDVKSCECPPPSWNWNEQHPNWECSCCVAQRHFEWLYF